ncbi:asparaginase [Mycolicibacterium goodii]|uniref:asparaginase n=1 Tax=Mycolicibacterium goodii TaxID=134601 RepID=A0A0K0XEA0_MYCGD|nr:asparaginase [Mycolicibacterium goodii]
MTRIAVIATGGTIASTATDSGVVATRPAANLVERAGVSGIDTEPHDLMTVGSYCMDLHHLRLISDAVAELLNRTDDPVDGIVITHGTDTLEETAILLDLVHDDPRPVVLTGAQRASDSPDADGPRNLADAILVAGDTRSREQGVLIVFAGQVLPARGTRKTHTSSLAAFSSMSGCPAGQVRSRAQDGAPILAGAAGARRPTPPLPRPTNTFDNTRVDLVEMYPGADDTLMRAAVAAGAKGIVLAGTGIGNANPVVVDAARDLVTRHDVAVVLSTRVPQGPVAGVYGNGGGADLVAAGIPAASGLPATQLRILLALWLSQHEFDASQIRSMIARYANDPDDPK